MDDVVSAWPGDAGDAWPTWIAEVGRSLGRPARVVDCEPQQALELAHHGATVITRPTGPSSWVAVVGGDSSRVTWLEPHGEPAHLTLSRSAAARKLKALGAAPTARYVVLDRSLLGGPPQEHGEDHHSGHHEESLLHRYWSLLKPESLDILTVIAFAVVTGILAMATPLAVEALVSTVAFGRMLQPVVVLALILLGFLSFSAALRGLQIFIVEILQRRLFARIAAKLAFRLPRAQVETMEHHYPPELVNRFFEVVTIQKVTATLLLDGVALVMSALIGMAVLGLYHPWLLGFDAVLIVMMSIAIFVLGRGAVRTSVKESKAKYATASWLEDIAACPTAFRYDGAQEFAQERADHIVFEYLTARKKHFRVLIRQMLFVLALEAVAATALLGLGGWLVISGQLTLGQLVAAELIVAVIVGAFAKLGKHLESFYDVMASMDKIGHLDDLPVESQDGQVTLSTLDGITLDLSQVVYRYRSSREGLQPIDWRVEPGSRWAVTGVDGSGKSTLFDLIYGLRRPTGGTLTINGIAPQELRPDALRRCVALTRGIEVFSGTIGENIHLMRPDVSVADIHEALKMVGLLEEVLSLPEASDTPLITGEGRPLTNGRLCRLMIARAIIGNPRLLIIDGTLDALPDDEAVAIVTRLMEPSKTWTLLISTTRKAVMDLLPERLHLEKATDRPMMKLEAPGAH
ncbi:Alpha-hemolysin translocation ATP-binding protein HlyB [Caulifigura coniformis]|uniref:Alpha-hemolysin translocation ATP-binding protein HlyB n=1 Tax=Caulifigura coniformis TaxID=2527983 RepID=A0A517SIQ8_9PLAN|nr:Alpha-hemolysin translocation ATP-binding protein HlyB [Caulifigura coniformis]